MKDFIIKQIIEKNRGYSDNYQYLVTHLTWDSLKKKADLNAQQLTQQSDKFKFSCAICTHAHSHNHCQVTDIGECKFVLPHVNRSV